MANSQSQPIDFGILLAAIGFIVALFFAPIGDRILLSVVGVTSVAWLSYVRRWSVEALEKSPEFWHFYFRLRFLFSHLFFVWVVTTLCIAFMPELPSMYIAEYRSTLSAVVNPRDHVDSGPLAKQLSNEPDTTYLIGRAIEKKAWMIQDERAAKIFAAKILSESKWPLIAVGVGLAVFMLILWCMQSFALAFLLRRDSVNG